MLLLRGAVAWLSGFEVVSCIGAIKERKEEREEKKMKAAGGRAGGGGSREALSLVLAGGQSQGCKFRGRVRHTQRTNILEGCGPHDTLK